MAYGVLKFSVSSWWGYLPWISGYTTAKMVFTSFVLQCSFGCLRIRAWFNFAFPLNRGDGLWKEHFLEFQNWISYHLNEKKWRFFKFYRMTVQCSAFINYFSLKSSMELIKAFFVVIFICVFVSVYYVQLWKCVLRTLVKSSCVWKQASKPCSTKLVLCDRCFSTLWRLFPVIRWPTDNNDKMVCLAQKD